MKHGPLAYLDWVFSRSRVSQAWTDAEIFRLIEEAREAVEDRQYARALDAIEAMAESNPNDPYAQRLVKEAHQLLVEAEGHVSRSERLRQQEDWRGAFEELKAAIRTYDHLPGLWPLMFWFLPVWELDLRVKGRRDDGRELQEIRLLREEAASKFSQREQPWMRLESGAGAYRFSLDEPWPEVVRAFCDSRPAARVTFDRPPNAIPMPHRIRVEGAIADTIRGSRDPGEEWLVQHSAPADRDAYIITFILSDRKATLELHTPDTTADGVRRTLPQFLRENWPS